MKASREKTGSPNSTAWSDVPSKGSSKGGTHRKSTEVIHEVVPRAQRTESDTETLTRASMKCRGAVK
jgi:hypothetical protein